MPTPINSTSAASSAGPLGSQNENVKQSTLDQDAFLKLLSAQLKYQDPMNPVSNQDFLAQTAQFTSLEQITNLADATRDQLFGTQMSQGVQMIGKQVTFQPQPDIGSSEVPAPQNGQVESVLVKDGVVVLKIGAQEVPVSQVVEVK